MPAAGRFRFFCVLTISLKDELSFSGLRSSFSLSRWVVTSWMATGARRSKRQSILGADLDSLADIVSFGVAPAVLGFTLGMRGVWDMTILAYFVVCGISRLARFNVTAAELSR